MKHALLVTLVFYGFTWTAEASSTNTTTKAGKYDIPIPVLFGVTLEDITPNFGEPRGGGTRIHEGLDILAPEGTPIVSPVKATVVSYGYASTPGNYVYTKGADGHLYWYMHLDEIAKLKRGQKLKVGDLIGTVGETGNAKGTTPHLHFEVRKGKPLDPYARIKKEFTLEEKIQFLNNSLADLKGTADDDLVKLMVTRYRGILTLAEANELTLNKSLATALKKEKGGMTLASSTLGLKKGSSGSDVAALQNALIKANMGPQAYRLAQAGATGYFGAITHEALIEYQASFGILADGILSLATKNSLLAFGSVGQVKGIATTTGETSTPHSPMGGLALLVPDDIMKGARGENVMLLQQFLMGVGSGAAVTALKAEGATGYFGELTSEAVREYQRSEGIPETGIYDRATRDAILKG